MRYSKCCIPNCGNKRQDVKLHKFPTCQKRAKKWLGIINCKELKRLNSAAVNKLQVCDKYFETRFRTAKSYLNHNAYPSLLTPEEIANDIPSICYDEQEKNNPHHEHTYARKDPICSDHNYCKYKDSSEFSLSTLEGYKSTDDLTEEEKSLAVSNTKMAIKSLHPDTIQIKKRKRKRNTKKENFDAYIRVFDDTDETIPFEEEEEEEKDDTVVFLMEVTDESDAEDNDGIGVYLMSPNSDRGHLSPVRETEIECEELYHHPEEDQVILNTDSGHLSPIRGTEVECEESHHHFEEDQVISNTDSGHLSPIRGTEVECEESHRNPEEDHVILEIRERVEDAVQNEVVISDLDRFSFNILSSLEKTLLERTKIREELKTTARDPCQTFCDNFAFRAMQFPPVLVTELQIAVCVLINKYVNKNIKRKPS